MIRKYIFAVCCWLFAILLAGSMTSCSRKEADVHWALQSCNILTNISSVRFGSDWNLIHATGTKWYAPFDQGSHNTMYLLLHTGTLAADKELLSNLEHNGITLVEHKPIADAHASGVADWWHPELHGESTMACISVTNANHLYLLTLEVFQTKTNSMLFTSIHESIR